MDYINIPEDRISVLIGPKGTTKRRIEKLGESKLRISNNGNVTIEGENIIVKSVVEAIGRGFNPRTAMKLFDDEYLFEIIELTDYSNSKNRLGVIRARVIGREGAVRKSIEVQTGVNLAIKGKTVSIIGKSEAVYLARRSLEMILAGSQHGSSFRWLKDQLSD